MDQTGPYPIESHTRGSHCQPLNIKVIPGMEKVEFIPTIDVKSFLPPVYGLSYASCVATSTIEMQHYYDIMKELNIDVPNIGPYLWEHIVSYTDKEKLTYTDKDTMYFDVCETPDKKIYRYYGIVKNQSSTSENIVAIVEYDKKTNFNSKKLVLDDDMVREIYWKNVNGCVEVLSDKTISIKNPRPSIEFEPLQIKILIV